MEGLKQQSKHSSRLVLFPAPFQGHQTPMFHLATLLNSKGFSITIIQTPYKPVNPSQYPNFTFHFLVNSLLESYSESPPSDVFAIISSMNDTCAEPFRDCLSQILHEAEAEPVAALIADPLCAFVGPVAASFNLPRITLRTGCTSALLVYLSVFSSEGMRSFPLQDAKSEEPLPELAPLKVKDLPPELDNNIYETYTQEIKTSQGVICNTFKELEDSSIARVQQTLLIPIFPIGPLHKHSPTSTISTSAQDQTTIAWLNTQAPKSVLYASFGTVAPMRKDEFLEVAWGLLESKVPFLWVIRHGLISGSKFNDSLPEGYIEMMGERGHIVKWAPQLEVLAHQAVGGFWTHNGWNSTLESICESVPMLCQPLFADQGINARHVSDGWRIGLNMEKGVKRKEIASTIRKLMLEEEGAEMRNRVITLKEKAILCLKEGGSSYNSLEKLSSYLLSF